MAKTRSKKGLSKQLQVAIVLGVVLAVMMYGGQITGMGTGGVANMTITITGSTSCALTQALHTATSVTGGTAAVVDSSGTDSVITNDGNVDLILTVNASTAVDSLFSEGTTVNLECKGHSGGASCQNVSTLTTSLETLCDDLETAETCTFQFDTTATAAEAAGTYVFEYDIICAAT